MAHIDFYDLQFLRSSLVKPDSKELQLTIQAIIENILVQES